jgi:hypothetical protein
MAGGADSQVAGESHFLIVAGSERTVLDLCAMDAVNLGREADASWMFHRSIGLWQMAHSDRGCAVDKGEVHVAGGTLRWYHSAPGTIIISPSVPHGFTQSDGGGFCCLGSHRLAQAKGGRNPRRR